MCWDREEAKKKMEELFPDFIWDDTITMTANIRIVKDKADVEVNSQPSFTLTAEEVRIVEMALYDSIIFNDRDLAENGFAMSRTLADSVRRERTNKYNIIGRIKQWQNKKSDPT